MDILFLVGGATFGTILAGMFVAIVPDLDFTHKIAISLVGSFLGFGVGFLLMWVTKHEEIKQNELHKRRVRERIPLPKQIVGKKCAQCQASIIFVNDGHLCPICNQVKCKNCEPTIPCRGCENTTYVAEIVD